MNDQLNAQLQEAYDELVAEHMDGLHADADVYGCPSCEDEHGPILMFHVSKRE